MGKWTATEEWCDFCLAGRTCPVHDLCCPVVERHIFVPIFRDGDAVLMTGDPCQCGQEAF